MLDTLPPISYTQSIKQRNNIPLYRTHWTAMPVGEGNVMRHGEPLEGEKNVQIVHRVATVLRALGNQGLLGITDLAHVTGLPKSTTHRLVTALVNEGLLVQNEDSHKYTLSLRVTALGASILSSHAVRKTARPILMELRDQTRESVHLAVLEGIDAVAAPIFDHLNSVVAAVSIGGPSERCHPRQGELIAAVTRAGQQISQTLRYVGWH